MTRLLLLALVLVAACLNSPVQTDRTDNPDVPVALLFEHDGCKVYRFADGGYHYYARCGRESLSLTNQRRESCGKHCRRDVDDVIAVREP